MRLDDLESIDDEVLRQMLYDRHMQASGIEAMDDSILEHGVDVVGCWHMVLVDLDGSGAVRRVGLDAKLALVEQYATRVRAVAEPFGAQFAWAGSRDEVYLLFISEDPSAGVRVAEGIRASVAARRFDLGHFGRRWSLTASVGVASRCGRPPTSAHALAAQAREALSVAKRERDAVAVAPEMTCPVGVHLSRATAARLEDVSALQRAMHLGVWLWSEQTGPVRYWTCERPFLVDGRVPDDLDARLADVEVPDWARQLFRGAVELEVAHRTGTRAAPAQDTVRVELACLPHEIAILGDGDAPPRAGWPLSHRLAEAIVMACERDRVRSSGG